MNAKERYPYPVAASGMTSAVCAHCGSPADSGFLTTTNGSGLFWAHDAPTLRLRPKGLEVLVGTGFGGSFSASLAATRCGHCGTLLVQLPKSK